MERIAVFVDYQNVYGWGLRLFKTKPGNIVPLALGELLAKRRERASELASITLYRGRPHHDRQPKAAAASDRQTLAWEESDSRVSVVRRGLQYPRNWPTQPANEKGIDVALAAGVITTALKGEVDAIIMFSADTDLLPAIEAALEHSATHIETAAWSGTPKLRIPGQSLWCHFLTEADYHSVLDPTDYTKD